MSAANEEQPRSERTELARYLGTRTGNLLAALGLSTSWDLLRHYPRRYIERGQLTPLAAAVPGEYATYVAKVVSFDSRPIGSKQQPRSSRGTGNDRRSLVKVAVSDGQTTMTLTFFARNPGLVAMWKRQLGIGTVAMFAGTAKYDYNGHLELVHPEVDPLDDPDTTTPDLTKPLPIYPITKGLTNRKILTSIRTFLDPLSDADLPDPLPEQIRRRRALMTDVAALRAIHRPETIQDAHAARERLRYDEAFMLQLTLARRRSGLDAEPATPRPQQHTGLLAELDAQLPFTLTAGQRDVADQISTDLARTTPMRRLLQGDVGSGKTVVALRAMAQVVDTGGQAVLLAPTEVLAHQHARTLAAMLGPLAEAGMLTGSRHATRLTLLTGTMKAAERKHALLQIASGEAGIVVGTHALLTGSVQFADLGLVVVDEQHRFGVEQRDALREQAATTPHQLVMTATPIPRSVAMTVFGDVDTSTLRERPAARAAIQTHVVPAAHPAWMQRTWQRVAEEIAAGGRVYVVTPKIGGDAGGDDGAELIAVAAAAPLATVVDVAAQLRAEPALGGIDAAVLHGRLSSEEKDAVMADFSSGASPLLVTTTVIEVGVDVPEATMMVIMDADRFGLAQVHQLRGRIGRGTRDGICLLITSAEADTPAMERLNILASTTDGFALAEADLEQRREGDVLGRAQSGRASSLKLLRVLTDRKLIETAREDARQLIDADPDLNNHPLLAQAISEFVDPDHEEFLDRG